MSENPKRSIWSRAGGPVAELRSPTQPSAVTVPLRTAVGTSWSNPFCSAPSRFTRPGHSVLLPASPFSMSPRAQRPLVLAPATSAHSIRDLIGPLGSAGLPLPKPVRPPRHRSTTSDSLHRSSIRAAQSLRLFAHEAPHCRPTLPSSRQRAPRPASPTTGTARPRPTSHTRSPILQRYHCAR